MLLTDVFCYAILMITITESWAYPEEHENHVTKKRNPVISRRDSTVLIEGAAPVEKIFQRPKVIRRLSKKRQAPIRTTYGPPRTKYGPSRTVKNNKYRGKATKHSGHRVRGHKPRYGVPKKQAIKPVYGPPKTSHIPNYSYFPEGHGFAEPPTNGYSHHNTKNVGTSTSDYHTHDNEYITKPDYDTKPYEHQFSSPTGSMNEFQNNQYFDKPNYNEFHNPKQSYGEPPVDSYGAPIKENLHDLTYSPTQNYPESDQKYNYINQPWQNFNDLKLDGSNNYSQTKTFPLDHQVNHGTHEEDEQNLNSYSDIYNLRQVKEKKKKKASYYGHVKLVNHPWKGKMKDESNEEIVVGGQYAEPPARYVPKFEPSAVMMSGDNEFMPVDYLNPNNGQLATISSYVNYKNSNMAFSPQNLNDAFSIVDKK